MRDSDHQLHDLCRWVSGRDAAQFLGVSVSTVKRLAASGSLPVIHVSPKRRRYDVAGYVAQLTAAATRG